MRRIGLALVASLLSFSLMWPQAQPKSSPSPTSKATAPAAPGSCAADYHRNSDGVCVHRPMKSYGSVPQGGTAQCRDESYSLSQHRRGTCSHPPTGREMAVTVRVECQQ